MHPLAGARSGRLLGSWKPIAWEPEAGRLGAVGVWPHLDLEGSVSTEKGQWCPMARMTPEQEARYALNWEVARCDLPKDAQLAYDHLAEMRADARVPGSLAGEMTAVAAGRGHLRASHSDRDHVIDALKAAFVQGRLTRDEFDLRVSQTLTSRTYADLARLTADLPARPTGARLGHEPAPPVNRPLLWGAYAVLVAAVGVMVVAFPAGSLLLLTTGVLAILIAAPVAGMLTLDSWREDRSRGQLPQAG
jgi:hypothetical protein